jgi:hypothetical protein
MLSLFPKEPVPASHSPTIDLRPQHIIDDGSFDDAA